MPLHRSLNDGENSREDTVILLNREERRAVTTPRTIKSRSFEDEENLKSPDKVITARLGISPAAAAIVSPCSTSSPPPSPPRYMSYRNNLAERLHSPLGGGLQGPKQPLDPVILSFDRSREDDGESVSSDEISSSLGSRRRAGRPFPLHAPPPSDLRRRAHRYRLDDPKEQFNLLDAVNASVHSEAWAHLEYSSDRELSDATEPTCNSAATEPTSNRRMLSPSLSPDEASASSDEETAPLPQGPGRMYLKVLKNQKVMPKAPTPPRRTGNEVSVPDNLLSYIPDEETASEKSATFDRPSLAQLSDSGEVMFVHDLQSDEGSDLPPELRPKVAPKQPEPLPPQACSFIGACLILLALLLLIALILFIFLVPKDWSFGKQANAENNLPITQFPTIQSTSVPTIYPTGSESVRTTMSPTYYKQSLNPSKSPSLVPSAEPSTLPPTWDPILLDRLGEAVSLLSFWSRPDLWDSPNTPQAKALYWLIENSEWDSYSDERKIQRYGLAVFYFATEGDLWTNSDGWMTNNHECSWYTSSVIDVCGDDNMILRILHLEQNNVRGTLPPELGILTNLWEIRLESNQIYGVLPSQWSRLTNLRLLVLRDNMLAGGNLPSELSALSQLQILDLSENRLGGPLPDFVSEYTELTYLLLAGNGFIGQLPQSWSRMQRLRVLSVENNRLTGGVPLSYGEGLLELRELRMQTNFFDSWNASVWQFPNLRLLDLSDNRLSGEIPSTLYGLELLTNLNLANNLISGRLAGEIGNLILLEDLDLSYNSISGSIPFALGNARDLRTLLLQHNQFTGDLPGSLRRLRQITRLRIDGNALGQVSDNVCRGLDDTLLEFYADCDPDNPNCDCCTFCCDDEQSCVSI